MQGFDVVTSDDCKAGRVVELRGNYLIVEHGTLFKSRHAVPRELAHVSDGEHTVRLTIAKQVLDDSPKVNGDELDERTLAEHYGLAEGAASPPTEGYGDVLPGDPARSADQDQVRAGLTPAEEERAGIRAGMRTEGETGEESPGLLGDRHS